jgi:hypothetical protein
MKTCTSWIFYAMQKRSDAILQHIAGRPKIHRERRVADECLQRLKESLNEEQQQLFHQWEERINYMVALEHEALYHHGFIDGIHAAVTITDIKPSGMESW